MANEIEAKFKVSKEQAGFLKSQLVKYHQGSRHEVNEFYDKKSKLKNADQVLRIRTFKETGGAAVVGLLANKAVVTFKGKTIRSKLKVRPEIEYEAIDPNSVRKVFEALGYEKSFSFEKRRDSHLFRNCVVEIDEVPGLGFFIEIEGKTVTEIEIVRNKLGLDDLKCIKDGYPSLLAKFHKKKKIKKVTF
jgi:adenylate cyclase class 2